MANPSREAQLDTRPSLTVKRRLNASPQKVYSAWTDPEKIICWFGPQKVKPGSLKADIDLRTGGRYRLCFTTEGGEYSEVGGVYREVVPNARLVFSWAWHSTPERESQVTLTFKPDGDGTLLTLHHEQFADQAARDAHERGWNEIVDKLRDHLT